MKHEILHLNSYFYPLRLRYCGCIPFCVYLWVCIRGRSFDFVPCVNVKVWGFGFDRSFSKIETPDSNKTKTNICLHHICV